MGIFLKNKFVLIAFIVGCVLFMLVRFLDSSKYKNDIIPILRGEVKLPSGYIITSINGEYPIVIPKYDDQISQQIRYSGHVKSIYATAANTLSKTGNVVVDVGAYFGYNDIVLGNKMRLGGEIYAFEPNNEIFKHLKKTIALNELEEIVTLKNIALSDEKSSFNIHNDIRRKKDNNNIAVDGHILDEELPGVKVDLLMVDILGSEFKVIAGAKKIIDNSPNIKILINFDREDEKTYVDINKVLLSLQKDGFMFFISKDGYSFKEVNIQQILSEKSAVIVISKLDVSKK